MPPAVPVFFEEVRAAAEALWQLLEAQPRAAAPWTILFEQVRDVRHLLSELFQNADDAGAQSIWVRTSEEALVLEHDGKDFTESDFRTLCEFGLSNKRTLTTTGFRGIGFKATFSAGRKVRLDTPTLHVEFDERRFTLPVWNEKGPQTRLVRVEVPWRDREARRSVSRSLERWRTSPASLLFFRSVRQLDLDGHRIRSRRSSGAEGAPAAAYELEHESPGEPVARTNGCIFRSEPLKLPLECSEELQDLHRVKGGFGEAEVSLDLATGMQDPQRLFSVLPTDASWGLPFSCNAPFVLTPDRSRLKDLALSPTNRWLLRQIGMLAARRVEEWATEEERPLGERAAIYSLLPSGDSEGHDLGQVAAAAVREAFLEEIDLRASRLLVRVDGTAGSRADTRRPPNELRGVWDDAELMALLGATGAVSLASEVSAEAVERLEDLRLVEEASDSRCFETLFDCEQLPKPETWAQLAGLWTFAARMLTQKWGEHAWSWFSESTLGYLALAPVLGSDYLAPLRDAVRPPTKPAALSDREWGDLLGYVPAIDPAWLSWVRANSTAPGLQAVANGDLPGEAAARIMASAKLGEATRTDRILRLLGQKVFADRVDLATAIGLSHVLAKLEVDAPDSWRWFDATGSLADRGAPLLSGLGEFDELLPGDLPKSALLHPDYHESSGPSWVPWVESKKSGLLPFLLPKREERSLGYDLAAARAWASQRGHDGPSYARLVRSPFGLEDYDYPESWWARWQALREGSSTGGILLMRALLAIESDLLVARSKATIFQDGYSNRHLLEEVRASWLHRLRQDAWIPDEYGRLRHPAKLVRRTPDTEPLRGVETFVHPDLDREVHAWFWDQLGVGTRGQNVDGLLERLTALVGSASPALDERLTQEVRRLLEALDRLLSAADSSKLAQVRAFFDERPLILDEGRVPRRASEIYQENPAGLAAATVHPELSAMPMLWERLSIRKRPSEKELLEWVSHLPLDLRPGSADRDRLKRILERSPVAVAAELGRWLAVDGTLREWKEFRAATVKPEFVRRELFASWAAETADLSFLTAELLATPAFGSLRRLELHVQRRAAAFDPSEESLEAGVLRRLGRLLNRVALKSDGLEPLGRLGERLAVCSLTVGRELRAAPYLDGFPVGEERDEGAVWEGTVLLVRSASAPHRDLAIARLLASEIEALVQGTQATHRLVELVGQSIGREGSYVAELFEHEFDLAPGVDQGPETQDSDPTSSVPKPPAELERVVSGDSLRHREGLLEERGGDDPGAHTSVGPRSRRLPLRFRLARALGFQFYGKVLLRGHSEELCEAPRDEALPWEVRSYPRGEILERLATAEAGTGDTFQIKAETWEALKGHPSHSLVIFQSGEAFTRLDGAMLQRMREEGALLISAASFRLRLSESVAPSTKLELSEDQH